MKVGYNGDTQVIPPQDFETMTVELAAGSFYDMPSPFTWHDVNPIGGPSISLMLTGRPFWDDKRYSEVSSLTEEQRAMNKVLTKQRMEEIIDMVLISPLIQQMRMRRRGIGTPEG